MCMHKPILIPNMATSLQLDVVIVGGYYGVGVRRLLM